MGRAPCCDKNGLKKGPWTPEEDQKLIDYIQKHGYGNWRTLPKNAGLQRCGKSCRLRWTNYLRPDIKRGRFSFEEEETIVQLHSILGNKWSAIAARLPGRTDNEIKNYWNTHIRKRLLRMGIDPVTHSPRLDLLDFSSLFNSSQIHNNISRFLGVQQQQQPIGLNPELLRLATSLIQSQREHQNNPNPNFFLQNGQEQNQLCIDPQLVQSSQIQPPIQHISPVCTTLDSTTPSIPSFTDHQQLLMQHPNADLSEWQQSTSFTDQDQYVVPLPSFSCYGSDDQNDHHHHQAIVDILSSETSNFNSSNQNFGFTSVFSTPSSSPTPLNSNSTAYNFNSCTSTEDDEREISYCSNMLKFDIPDILDVNEFMSYPN